MNYNYILPPVGAYKQPWRTFFEIYATNGVIDRTHTIDFGFEYTVISKIPTDYNTLLSFKEITNLRIQDIINNASKPILLLWSGGIDSTVILAGLIQTGIEFTVAYSNSTQAEYPLMFKRLQNKFYGRRISMIEVEQFYLSDLQNEYQLLTGNIGDQLVGVAGHYMRDGSVRPQQLEPYRELMPEFLNNLLEESVQAFPINIIDFADWMWWVNFNLKYQPQALEHSQSIGVDPTKIGKYSNFFDSDNYQRWAISNRDINKHWLRKNKPNEYKQVYKQYIFDIIKDSEYFTNKRKVGSMNDTIKKGRSKNICIINNNDTMEVIKNEHP